jgi:hypothetical protein
MVLAAKVSEDKKTKYDHFSFEQEFVHNYRVGNKAQNAKASGHHKVLDYLCKSLSLPLYYHPHNMFSHLFTKTVRDMLPQREKLNESLSQQCSLGATQHALRTLISAQFACNDMYKSDFDFNLYQAQGAVTPLHN